MIDDAIITRVFENIINNGELVNVTDKRYLVFKVGEHHVEILILNETKHDDEVTNVPLSIDKLTRWRGYPWEWTVYSAIKPGVLLTYHIHTSFNDYIVKPKLSKQEEYKEIIDKHLHEFELKYLQSLL
jgi:hypothetical protein